MESSAGSSQQPHSCIVKAAGPLPSLYLRFGWEASSDVWILTSQPKGKCPWLKPLKTALECSRRAGYSGVSIFPCPVSSPCCSGMFQLQSPCQKTSPLPQHTQRFPITNACGVKWSANCGHQETEQRAKVVSPWKTGTEGKREPGLCWVWLSAACGADSASEEGHFTASGAILPQSSRIPSKWVWNHFRATCMPFLFNS